MANVQQPRFLPLPERVEISDEEMCQRARDFAARVSTRRTVRHFSDRPVPLEIIREAIRAAGSAPSGANQQPWHFVVVSDPDVKTRIRTAAESEEKAFYEERAPREWLEALAHIGTDSNKPFLESAPYLIAVFVQPFDVRPDGTRVKHYYAQESVGLATGILITALHDAGLATLTHTPSPMGFLNEILGRPSHERAFLLLVVGHPEKYAVVPDIRRKELDDIATFI